ncbi:NB-ARC domain-containing protein [Streptomyces mirabilis]|uniref:NB-ARC domain-containing protein n=1 Tax=Streptomyces mirabilis TaxID=68239 RepID=UPI00369A450D
MLGKGTQINHFPSGLAPTALNSLPAVPPGFTGRNKDLAELLEALDPRAGSSGAAAAIVSLAGLPGVGKTSLAVAAGHAGRDQGWFDGTLFVDLQGYGKSPVEPAQALEALLRSLGVEQGYIPPTLNEREGLYRSQLGQLAASGRAVLVVADNAATAKQVRPLLPGMGQHRLLVTSRNTLSTLGGRLLDLGVLRPEASVHLLDTALRISDPTDSRITDNEAAAHTLAQRCGYLPLALQIAAARLIADRNQPVEDLAAQLEEVRTRLAHLNDGERGIRASFSLSFQRLRPPLVETLLLLGLAPGTDFGLEAAAALTDRQPENVRTLLVELVQAHLLERGLVEDRWRMHDMIRAYAGEQADTCARQDRHAARAHQGAQRRLLEHFTVTAEAARPHVDPSSNTARSPYFDSREQAVQWLDAEIPNLVAVSVDRRSAEDHRLVLRLHDAVRHYLNSGYIHEWLTISCAAVRAAHALRNLEAEAGALESCAIALSTLSRHQDADEAAQKARQMCRRGHMRKGEASTLDTLGIVAMAADQPERAAKYHQQAQRLYQSLHDTHHEARAWTNLAQSLMAAGPHLADEAFQALENAVDICRRHEDERGLAYAMSTKATALAQFRRFAEAISCTRTVVELCRNYDDFMGEAQGLRKLSEFLLASGEFEEAAAVGQRAVEAHRRVWQNQPMPSASFAMALATYAAALYRSRKDLSSSAAAIDEALALFDQIPRNMDPYRAWARGIGAEILARLGRSRKHADVRRRLQARLGTAKRRRRWPQVRSAPLIARVLAFLKPLPRAAWVAVAGCGFTEARQAQASVWLLILYSTVGLFATGFLRIGTRGHLQTGQSSNAGCSCAPTLLATLTLVVSLAVPELLGPLSAAGEELAHIIGLA